MPLTDVAIRNAKPAANTVKLSDGGGLQLWIEPKGGKLWRLAYRFDGKQKKLSIGTYPAIDLRAARAKREEAKALLRDGKDPGAEKRLEKLTGKANRENTFEAIAARSPPGRNRAARLRRRSTSSIGFWTWPSRCWASGPSWKSAPPKFSWSCGRSKRGAISKPRAA